MKTFFRILSFAKPIGPFVIGYFTLSLLSNIFGVLGLGLLIPVLDILFNKLDTENFKQFLVEPAFRWETSYVWSLFQYYFAHIVVQKGKMGALQFVGMVLLGSIFIKNIFLYASLLIRDSARIKVVKNVRKSIYEKVTHLQIGFFSNQRRGDLIAKMTSDAREIEEMVLISQDFILRDPIYIVILFSVLFYLSPQLTFFALLVIPLVGGLIALVGNTLRRRARGGQEAMSDLISIFDETLGALRIVKAYNATDYVRKNFNLINQRFARMLYSQAKNRELASPFSEFGGVIVVMIILLYGGSLIFAENTTITASVFITYIAIFSQVITPIKAMSSAMGVIQKGIVGGQRIFEVLDAPQTIDNQVNAIELKTFEKSIEFKNVSFKYENKWILKNINLTIEKGKKIALVGETGSGKSTIADLIPRFYEVNEGEILLDGHNLKEFQLNSLWDKMGIVTQEAILFNDTIYNNIAFSSPHATQEEVENAARIANAHNFILQTENGYQTKIGDRGMKLAGGQRQRITIARAVLKNPPILILDEATSALDNESEKLVQDALYKLMQNRTSLVIAHRLSTIQDADKILVLKNGEIIEEGNHLTLMQKEDGIYKRLNLLQTS